MRTNRYSFRKLGLVSGVLTDGGGACSAKSAWRGDGSRAFAGGRGSTLVWPREMQHGGGGVLGPLKREPREPLGQAALL